MCDLPSTSFHELKYKLKYNIFILTSFFAFYAHLRVWFRTKLENTEGFGLEQSFTMTLSGKEHGFCYIKYFTESLLAVQFHSRPKLLSLSFFPPETCFL